MNDLAGTKLALIHAAGELFAEHGFEGTSIRAIAEKVGANIAAINYHFGSKENLYTEVLRYVLTEAASTPPMNDYLNESKWPQTPEGLSTIIEHMVKDWFHTYFSTDQPRWYGKVIIRSMLYPTASLETVLKQILEPDHEALKAIIKRCKSDMPDEEARLWAFSLLGQLSFYVFGEVPILMFLQKNSFDTEFLEAAAAHISRMTIAALGLPQSQRS